MVWWAQQWVLTVRGSPMGFAAPRFRSISASRSLLCDYDGVSLTVENLVEDPLIRTRIVAGSSGGGRMVTWAHTCELTDPWNWLGSGDLLMTDGYGFPADPEDQAEFVRNLARVNIAGLALAEGFAAPPLTSRAVEVADQLAFPVLMTERNVPFVTIARRVAESDSSRSSIRSTRVLRLYDVLRRTHLDEADADALLDNLAREIGARLHVIELRRGRELLPTGRPLPDKVRVAALEVIRARDGVLPASTRLQLGDEVTGLLLPVARQNNAAMIVYTQGSGELPDLVLAQHVAMIAELDVERRAARALQAREVRSTLARRLLEASISLEAAAAQLESAGLGPGPWRVSAWQPRDAANEADLSADLSGLDIAHLSTTKGDLHVVILPDESYVEPLNEALGVNGAVVGVSQPVLSAARISDAWREARWALEAAHSSASGSAAYGARGSYFMPRTVAEGEAVVDRLLGPLLEYDRANDTRLVASLMAFFEANRSWQEGAKRLGIHKHTLVYRMKKVEHLLGMDLRDSGTQAELFLALKTWQLLQLD